MQANLAEVPSTSAADGAAAAPVSAARAAGTVAGAVAGAVAGNAFVINLISSTTPVVLTRPDHAGLKRFTFFVSRRREDGRERFRLHMGYFDTQEEAEKLLDIVRSIYPGAWAGLAPGRRLAGGGAPAAGTAVAGATAVAGTTAIAGATAVAGATDASPIAVSPIAASPIAASPKAAASITSATSAAVKSDSAGSDAKPQPATPRAPRAPSRAIEVTARAIEAPALALMPDEGRRQLSDVTLDLEEPVLVPKPAADKPSVTDAAPAATRLPSAASQDERERQAARRSYGNVRDTIASLDDNAIRAPALSEIPELKPAIIPIARPVVRPVQTRPASAQADLTDTATLRLLETGDAAKAERTAKMPALAATASPRQSAPAPREEKPWYAVQLMWAVQPIALAQVPQLAIFSAYTLYGAEGNRDGRRWYGLRLGFFTDAVSAKQVAHYVRGDFATVSVVPVTSREREHALQAIIRATPSGKGAADASGAASGARVKDPEFAFIEGTESQITRLRPSSGNGGKAARAAQPPADARPGGPPLVGGKRPSRGAPGKRAKPRPAGQVHARARTKPRTLEETLEILGAGELQVADGSVLLSESSTFANDAGAGKLKSEAAKAKSSSKLARLIDRLAERMGN